LKLAALEHGMPTPRIVDHDPQRWTVAPARRPDPAVRAYIYARWRSVMQQPAEAAGLIGFSHRQRAGQQKCSIHTSALARDRREFDFQRSIKSPILGYL